MNIENIDVRETVKNLLDNPYAIESIVIGMEDEEKDLPIEEVPDPESFEHLLWIVKGQMEERDYFLQEPKAERLMAFAKLPRNKQQKILLRATVIQKRFFLYKSPLIELFYVRNNL